MFGAGLSNNVREGYRWLMQNYNEGDEIFLFGFSRGAFTARSLAGLIARCGLLKPEAPMGFWDVFERYQRGNAVRPIYELIRQKDTPGEKFDFEENVLLQHSRYHRDLIKMVGVWDTVGSIGIPFGKIKGVSLSRLRFHDTHLSKVVQHSYQALAVDENRRPYWAILWTNFLPNPPDPHPPALPENRVIEQRWFSGAHSNVGGGYHPDLLPQRPLAWLQEKAKACGLAFRAEVKLDGEDLKMGTHDSYKEFLLGLWKVLTFGRRYVRWVQADNVKKEKGLVETVNERIDLSVFERCRLHPGYHSASLCEWTRRKKLDVNDIIANPEKYAELWAPVTKPGIHPPVTFPPKD
jgi:hypothetical protein